MKTQRDWQRERQELAEELKRFNNRACIHFAEILRKHDEYKSLSRQLGENPADLIPVAYFEAVYKILSYAPAEQRLAIMAGTPEEIEKLVSEIQTAGGFYDEKGFWIEL